MIGCSFSNHSLAFTPALPSSMVAANSENRKCKLRVLQWLKPYVRENTKFRRELTKKAWKKTWPAIATQIREAYPTDRDMDDLKCLSNVSHVMDIMRKVEEIEKQENGVDSDLADPGRLTHPPTHPHEKASQGENEITKAVGPLA